uniref:Uncharacterized protein n=1 Tax=Saccharum spontaneum TaxID=62335 RepID=A0A678T542_SACSP|nr:hypothetical protein SS04J15_000009 [Saccharum spontaneum]
MSEEGREGDQWWWRRGQRQRLSLGRSREENGNVRLQIIILAAITDSSIAGGSPEEQEEQKMKQQPPKASKRKARGELPQVSG